MLDRSDALDFVSLSGGGRLRLQRDGVDYRLDPMPIESCLAAYDHAADSK